LPSFVLPERATWRVDRPGRSPYSRSGSQIKVCRYEPSRFRRAARPQGKGQRAKVMTFAF